MQHMQNHSFVLRQMMFKPFYVNVTAHAKKTVFIAKLGHQRPILWMTDRKGLPLCRFFRERDNAVMVHVSIARDNVLVSKISCPHAPIAFLAISHSEHGLIKASDCLQRVLLDKHAEADVYRNFDRL